MIAVLGTEQLIIDLLDNLCDCENPQLDRTLNRVIETHESGVRRLYGVKTCSNCSEPLSVTKIQSTRE